MQQFPNEALPEPAPQDAAEQDGKVIRFVPRRRPAAEQAPPPHDDNDDPGPSAA